MQPQEIADVAAPSLLGFVRQAATNIRVMIASPVHLVRESLAAALCGRDGVTIAGAIDLGPAGVTKITNAEPDVVLVDLGQADPGMAARLIRAACPRAKLVGFALDEVDDRVFACAAAGFSGYVPRESGADELHRAVLDAVQGRMRCAPHIAAAMFSRLAILLRDLDPTGALPDLSSRESEILVLVAQGRSNKEIARQLAISAATVKNHVHNVLLKLQVSRRGQAAARLLISRAA